MFTNPTVLTVKIECATSDVAWANIWLAKPEAEILVPYDISDEAGKQYIRNRINEFKFVPLDNMASHEREANTNQECYLGMTDQLMASIKLNHSTTFVVDGFFNVTIGLVERGEALVSEDKVEL